VQVEPIKPALKAPGTKRLKLNCDEPLSNVAFNFNLHRYIKVERIVSERDDHEAGAYTRRPLFSST
jgi:hypothetical protein